MILAQNKCIDETKMNEEENILRPIVLVPHWHGHANEK